MNTQTIKTLAALTTSDVVCVYSGKDGKCCCGCAGKYSYHADPALRAIGEKRRGYAVDADDVNPRMIAKVLKLMQAPGAPVEYDATDCVSLVVGGRLYVLHLVPGVGVADPASTAAAVPAAMPVTSAVFLREFNADTHGTSLQVYLDYVTVEAMRAAFGAPDTSAEWDEGRGYTGHGWTFVGEDGHVFNIYARYGEFRIGARAGADVAQFGAWLERRLAPHTPTIIPAAARVAAAG